MRPLPEGIVRMLERPNPCVVAVVRPDGTPASSPVWYRWEDDRIVTAMGARSPRRRALDANPAVSVTVLDASTWLRQVTLRGTVESLADDPSHEVIDRISMHYDGRPYPDHAHMHAVARIRVEHWDQFGLEDLLD